MSKYSRDLESIRQHDTYLKAQYQELLYLREQVARLLFPIKASPPQRRKCAQQPIVCAGCASNWATTFL